MPVDGPELPSGGDEIIREVERLKKEPIQFRCLGMSAFTLIIVLVGLFLLWRSIR